MDYKELKEKFGNDFKLDEDTFNKMSVEKRESYIRTVTKRIEFTNTYNDFIKKEKEKLKKLGVDGYFKNK